MSSVTEKPADGFAESPQARDIFRVVRAQGTGCDGSADSAAFSNGEYTPALRIDGLPSASMSATWHDHSIDSAGGKLQLLWNGGAALRNGGSGTDFRTPASGERRPRRMAMGSARNFLWASRFARRRHRCPAPANHRESRVGVMNSMAQAGYSAGVTSLPKMRAVSRQRMGRIRFPPAKTL